MKLLRMLTLLAFANIALAEQIVIDNKTIFSNKISENEFSIFEKNIEEHKINSILVKNCSGGYSGAAARISTKIRNANLPAYMDGYVASACALIFVGGVTRELEPSAQDIKFMLHATIDATTKEYSPEMTATYIKIMNRQTNSTLSNLVVEKINESSSKNGLDGVYFLWSKKDEHVRDAKYCKYTNLFIYMAENCTVLKSINLYNQNILTK